MVLLILQLHNFLTLLNADPSNVHVSDCAGQFTRFFIRIFSLFSRLQVRRLNCEAGFKFDS